MSDLSNNIKHTKCVVFAAILAALSFVFLFVGAATSILDLTAIVAASACSVIAVIELRGAYPYLVWIVTSIISLLLLPDKFVAVEYILFGGIYPILKRYMERLPRLVSWVAKLVFFNVILTAAIATAKLIMNLPDDYGMVFSIPVYFFGNVFFVISDFALSLIVTLYIVKLRKQLKLDRMLK